MSQGKQLSAQAETGKGKENNMKKETIKKAQKELMDYLNHVKRFQKRDTTSAIINIYCEPIKCHISPILRLEGNTKVRAATLNLMPIVTCKNCETCKDTCYCLKDFWKKEVLEKWSINTLLALNHIEWFKNEVIKEIEENEVKVVRLHCAGDFPSQKYIDAIVEVATVCEETRFYWYTKENELFDFSELESLPNCNGVSSFLPNGKRNYGDKRFIDEVKKEFPDIAICPNGFLYEEKLNKKTKHMELKKAKVHCVSQCKYCLKHKYCAFLIH